MEGFQKIYSPLPIICKMNYAAPHGQKLPAGFYLFFTLLSVPNNLFSVSSFMFLDKHKLQEEVWGQDQTPAEHVSHSFDRK